ncbi:ATP-binding protein [Streptomyces sp. 110]|uniref:ATP-binding protein n=2 Tax=Streptomyces endocoffeicus TaxID=2898945 RepID=A0ABS1PTD4_9ACTN|nr:ATP-binding protein [Streptomyces endocoffeicus]MBL1115700.1 ATP-binding protein [Streptomyces endocoffeicus]
MTTENAPSRGTRPGQPAPALGEFAMRFTSTPRGARLARRLVSHRLAAWGYPYDSGPNETTTLIASELAANAVRHGRVPGRDFHVRLTAPLGDASGTIRIEVSDTRTEKRPALIAAAPDAETGRGLYLVSQLAERWAVGPRSGGGPGKTLWAEIATETKPSGPGSGPGPLQRPQG